MKQLFISLFRLITGALPHARTFLDPKLGETRSRLYRIAQLFAWGWVASIFGTCTANVSYLIFSLARDPVSGFFWAGMTMINATVALLGFGMIMLSALPFSILLGHKLLKKKKV